MDFQEIRYFLAFSSNAQLHQGRKGLRSQPTDIDPIHPKNGG